MLKRPPNLNIYDKQFLVDAFDKFHYSAFKLNKFKYFSTLNGITYDHVSRLRLNNLLQKFTSDSSFGEQYRIPRIVNLGIINKMKKHIILYKLAHET